MNRYVAGVVVAVAVPVGAVLSVLAVVGVAAFDRFWLAPRRPHRPWNYGYR